VGVRAERARLHRSEPTGGRELDQIGGRHAKVRLDDARRQGQVDRHLLAIGPEQVDGGGLLVARVVAAQVPPLAGHRLSDLPTEPVDREVDHVEAHCIARAEHELANTRRPNTCGRISTRRPWVVVSAARAWSSVR
jgi:hypothetical protein